MALAVPARRVAAAAAVAVACGAALAGCGSVEAVAELPPAATPDPSPPLAAPPAGRVVPAGDARVPPAEARDVVTAAGRTFALRREAQAVVVRRGDESPARRLPVAAEPVAIAAVDDARAVAVVSGRERVVDVFDARSLERVARLAAGAGPTRVAAGGADRFYVVDTTGDGLLVFRLRPEPQLTRRVALLGAPYAIAVDRVRGRLWVTLTATNEVVELSAGARPRVLRTLPSVRQPDAVAVEPRSGRAYVTGRADGVVQLVGP